jgi:hypothetical protein
MHSAGVGSRTRTSWSHRLAGGAARTQVLLTPHVARRSLVLRPLPASPAEALVGASIGHEIDGEQITVDAATVEALRYGVPPCGGPQNTAP